MFFVDATRSVSDSAARAGTLTYIHTYVCLSLCLRRSIAPSHRSFVRRRTRLGNRTARFNIFEIAGGAYRETSVPRSASSCYVLHFALALTPRVIGRIIGPVALFSRTASFLAFESDSDPVRRTQMRGRCSGRNVEAKAVCFKRFRRLRIQVLWEYRSGCRFCTFSQLSFSFV